MVLDLEVVGSAGVSVVALPVEVDFLSYGVVVVEPESSCVLFKVQEVAVVVGAVTCPLKSQGVDGASIGVSRGHIRAVVVHYCYVYEWTVRWHLELEKGLGLRDADVVVAVNRLNRHFKRR